MIIKLYEKIKSYIKSNIKFLIILITLMLVCSVKLPFYIDIPGGLLNVSDKVSLTNSNKSSGSFNLAYVSEIRATIPTLLYASINPNWDILKYKDVISENESIEENEYRNPLDLEEANQNAIIVGFDLAGEYYNISSRVVNVIYIYDEANTDLKIGDEIKEINNIKIKDKNELLDIIKESIGKITFKVINDDKEYERYAYKTNIHGEEIIGIVVCETKDVETNRNVEFKFKANESGPSGGFMMALSIYNYLTEKDITNGLKIVGTGTIDEDGNVGVIGGIKYKVLGADKNNADLFFAPADNYEEAIKTVNNNKLDLKIVKVENIKDAIDYLNNMNN